MSHQEFVSMKTNDDKEKRYFNSLNDRLENLLKSLTDLESSNRNLAENINSLIHRWDLNDEKIRSVQQLELTKRNLSERHRQKVFLLGQEKVLNEEANLVDRLASILLDVVHSYKDQTENFDDLLRLVEDEYRTIEQRLTSSQNQVQKLDEQLNKELSKFRSFLSQWSKISLEKQILLNEIQTLREHFNLRLAFNQEEIKEWKRLLSRISLDSSDFYRDYLSKVKHQLQMDYQKMSEEENEQYQIGLKTKLRDIEEHLIVQSDSQRKSSVDEQRFRNRLTEITNEFDQHQNQYRTLREETQRKRRILRDLENEMANRKRQNLDKNANLQHQTDLTRSEYQRLRDELDRLMHSLRFSIEEELKIYEALLNSLSRQEEARRRDEKRSQYTKTTTRVNNSDSNSVDSGLKNVFDRYQRRTTKTTTKGRRRSDHNARDQQQLKRFSRRREQSMIELDEDYLQRRVHITRNYKGNILIKFVDVNGRFVEIENTGNQSRDLTGWYIRRDVDGELFEYRFPKFELDSHKTVRIYGNEHEDDERTFSMADRSSFKLLATNFYDWGIGQRMRTELFNNDDVVKALFEQTIKD